MDTRSQPLEKVTSEKPSKILEKLDQLRNTEAIRCQSEDGRSGRRISLRIWGKFWGGGGGHVAGGHVTGRFGGRGRGGTFHGEEHQQLRRGLLNVPLPVPLMLCRPELLVIEEEEVD